MWSRGISGRPEAYPHGEVEGLKGISRGGADEQAESGCGSGRGRLGEIPDNDRLAQCDETGFMLGRTSGNEDTEDL